LVKTKGEQVHEETFTTKFGMLTAECLGKLLADAAHFNYATNLITCLVGLTITAYEPVR
jgi:hypothetical protein